MPPLARPGPEPQGPQQQEARRRHPAQARRGARRAEPGGQQSQPRRHRRPLRLRVQERRQLQRAVLALAVGYPAQRGPGRRPDRHRDARSRPQSPQHRRRGLRRLARPARGEAMSAMALLLDIARWTLTALAVAAGLAALWLWWRRPRYVAATRWSEDDDGWGTFV